MQSPTDDVEVVAVTVAAEPVGLVDAGGAGASRDVVVEDGLLNLSELPMVTSVSPHLNLRLIPQPCLASLRVALMVRLQTWTGGGRRRMGTRRR